MSTLLSQHEHVNIDMSYRFKKKLNYKIFLKFKQKMSRWSNSTNSKKKHNCQILHIIRPPFHHPDPPLSPQLSWAELEQEQEQEFAAAAELGQVAELGLGQPPPAASFPPGIFPAEHSTYFLSFQSVEFCG